MERQVSSKSVYMLQKCLCVCVHNKAPHWRSNEKSPLTEGVSSVHADTEHIASSTFMTGSRFIYCYCTIYWSEKFNNKSVTHKEKHWLNIRKCHLTNTDKMRGGIKWIMQHKTGCRRLLWDIKALFSSISWYMCYRDFHLISYTEKLVILQKLQEKLAVFMLLLPSAILFCGHLWWM